MSFAYFSQTDELFPRHLPLRSTTRVDHFMFSLSLFAPCAIDRFIALLTCSNANSFHLDDVNSRVASVVSLSLSRCHSSIQMRPSHVFMSRDLVSVTCNQAQGMPVCVRVCVCAHEYTCTQTQSDMTECVYLSNSLSPSLFTAVYTKLTEHQDVSSRRVVLAKIA